MSHESKPYCLTHVPKAGHTQVASVELSSQLSAPKAAAKVQGVSKTQRMTFAPGQGGRGAPRGGAGGAARGGAAGGAGGAPRSAPSGGGASAGAGAGGYRGGNTVKVGGGGNKCPGCGKTVYTNEEVKACGACWHKGCLKCTSCQLTLNLKALLSHANKPYCSTHVPKVSHTQVASVEMQNALKAPKAARAVKGVNRAARGTFAPGALNAVDPSNVVNRGGVAGNDVQSANAPSQTFVAPEPTPSISYDSYDDNSSSFNNLSVNDDQGGYDDSGYDQGGYDEGGYDQGGYDESGDQGYDQGGYEEGGDQGYEEGGYAEEGAYEEGGYAEEGAYEEGGYEEGGYEEGGYEEGGYDEGGYDEGGYDEEGYYDEGGYEEEGYY